MGREIERKFRVRGDDWRRRAESVRAIRQGYLAAEKERSVRVRVEGSGATLTVKGKTEGAVRAEYEYEIPRADAEAMLDSLCLLPLIEKTRHLVRHAGRVWEVDEFAGENAGLVVAEVELEAEDAGVSLPDWVGEEVTGDPRFYNANLVARPFSRW